MDFASLPPEINSGLMHSGPGAGSMARAATAWDGLAAGLRAAAARMAMTDAAAPYVDWLHATAARAEQAAAQAAAAAHAHRSARQAIVPTPAIAANRARRRSLAQRNWLGHAGPAIADTDAQYERMWAHDADAMYAYAAASAKAAALTPFASPPGNHGTGTWALASAPDVVAAAGRVMAAIPEALQALSTSPLTPLEAALSPVTPTLSRLSSLSAPTDTAISHLNSLNKRAALCALFTKPARAASVPGFGRGAPVGKLSTPRAWATATSRPRHPAVRAG
ncbi:PPE domain-containing protein [Mycobacterium terramassiliense]|uniref:PPE family protein n=1 Tax=Mycobacterium terramassiliense TaxID=1841859 RepID=A0A2U3N7N6_9MYCO|nr:PPE domain-containing protein [Mycobacterium terramassiliense]SPM27533.1 PPE family protein [Mycobacterium terramassiliense]